MRFNKSLIFTIGGCVGVVSTAVLAVRDATRSYETLKAIKEEGNKKEIFIETTKAFVPTIISGVATIGCIITAHVISARALAAMSLTLGYVIADRDRIMQKLHEYLPEDKIKELKQRAFKEGYLYPMVHDCDSTLASTPEWCPDKFAEHTGFGDTLCYFKYSGKFFYSDPAIVVDQLRFFNEELISRKDNYANLNDLFSTLNLRPTGFNEKYGWAPDFYDEKDGVTFDTYFNEIYRDGFGNIYDVKVFVIEIREHCYPIEFYNEY